MPADETFLLTLPPPTRFELSAENWWRVLPAREPIFNRPEPLSKSRPSRGSRRTIAVRAEVAELADAPDSKSGSLRGVWVRFPPSALESTGRQCPSAPTADACVAIQVRSASAATRPAAETSCHRPVDGSADRRCCLSGRSRRRSGRRKDVKRRREIPSNDRLRFEELDGFVRQRGSRVRSDEDGKRELGRVPSRPLHREQPILPSSASRAVRRARAGPPPSSRRRSSSTERGRRAGRGAPAWAAGALRVEHRGPMTPRELDPAGLDGEVSSPAPPHQGGPKGRDRPTPPSAGSPVSERAATTQRPTR